MHMYEMFIAGPPGYRGPRGWRGATGVPGLPGRQGWLGATGPRGYAGATGRSRGNYCTKRKLYYASAPIWKEVL